MTVLLPPAARSGPTLGLVRGAAQGRFALQRCGGCGAFLYPVRDVCPHCLSQDFGFDDAPDTGTLLSETTVNITSDPYFRTLPPVRQGLVQADCGVTMIAFVHPACPPEGRVRLSLKLDRAGMPVVYAHPETGDADMQDDPHWRALTADPKGRRVLITDAAHPAAQPLADALTEAGAEVILPDASELDLTSDASVTALADKIGATVDIVVHTAGTYHAGGIGGVTGGGTDATRNSLEKGALGLMRLAAAFGPKLGENAVAWVNLLSLSAQMATPGAAGYDAAQAATLSVAQSLRADMAKRGIRVINLFSGALDHPAFAAAPPPKLPPQALAKAVVAALQQGLEDVYVGPEAEEFRDRMAKDPKAVERMMWG
ncbi:SDR family oxidoreductase [Psychromarinibacter halotolerans]|uniref:SDR family oxidoreductase n=1 Tax=Psychromarinibacter halotolerans TaxID=1775175 RepID=A0ABV7GLR8_9RHOB